MPDEAALDPAQQDTQQDAPEVASQEGTREPEAQADTNWESRYKDLQAEYTRAQQQNSQYQELVEGLRDPERAAELFEALGYELEADEEDNTEYDDPLESVQARVERLEQERQAAIQQAQEAVQQRTVYEHLDEQFDRLEAQTGLKFSDKENAEEFKALQALAYANPIQDGPKAGLPDVEAAYRLLNDGVLPKYLERYRESKRGPQAPQGAAAGKQENLDTREAREDYIARRLQDVEVL